MDTLKCPDCFAPISAEDRFCEACGRNLLVRRTPIGGPTGPAQASCILCGSPDIDDEDYCTQCGRHQPSARDRVEYSLGAVSGVSDRGKRRARNEDSMAFGQVAGAGVAAVVCDGVASSERAEQASQAAADAAVDVLLNALIESADAEQAMVDAVAASCLAVEQLVENEPVEPGGRGVAPSCTFVSAVVTPSSVTVGWVGDSRAYWLAEEGSKQLTTDDTWAAQLVAEGVLTEEQARTDRRAHVLSRWIGADAGPVVPQVVTLRPTTPGTFLLCSDGLHNYRPQPEDLQPLLPCGPEEFVKVALDAGGHDNITVVLVPFVPGD
ncbi:serine/threonine protein phosphatase [Lentzea guizhouensis]|uniref:Serine/threonine protein phosphatase n=1 Tax=Lentzea guizhouensis TaxID=1586287 RepID=A0A1B2HSH3_9PSEU|nr:protein phosphatase 2C domain-containing protein [Lentzea guizhouensis]ANZ40663.1 serine/threonine protein phosphatase [Lentzea guizhouensis]